MTEDGLVSRDAGGLDPADFEMLRDSVGIAARRMTKEQVFEIADHLFAVLKRRKETVSWDNAREGGTDGFI
jgi:hypothetical protein